MTTKTPKPKPLPKWLHAELVKADMRGVDYVLVGPSVQAILLALKWERQDEREQCAEIVLERGASVRGAINPELTARAILNRGTS